MEAEEMEAEEEGKRIEGKGGEEDKKEIKTATKTKRREDDYGR
jgi:hypothetical protein